MAHKVLIVDPFLGEFGHELMRWQGCIRKIAKDYDSIIVGCKEGHELLYEDFATYIIRHKIIHADVVNCSIFKGQTQQLDKMPDLSKFEVKKIKPCIEICDKQLEQIFVPFGKMDINLKYDVVIHARNDSRKVCYGDRNWPLKNWIAVINSIKEKRIVSIGSIDAAFHVPGTEDLRGIPLKQLANILCNSKLCVGPSSGPMHFASICGCKHLVWSVRGPKGMRVGGGAETMVERYGRSWNPLMTPVKVIDKYDWKIPADIVCGEIRKML